MRITETVTLTQAGRIIKALAAEQSVLLLAPPGVGKSEVVGQIAAEAGLPLRSLLGTQIAPEDVSGVPRIVGERSVFCPPRVLLPEQPEPFCLFLDELPAASPDIQKAFYSVLLERRIGEYALPPGTWVVAAGNRTEDRALVRGMSSALCNRVLILHIRVDAAEWLAWAERVRIRAEIRAFVQFLPDALNRPVPAGPESFSTPRAWALLSRALDLCAAGGVLEPLTRRALAFGRVSAEDAAVFCAIEDEAIAGIAAPEHYVRHPADLPADDTARWFVLHALRMRVQRGELRGFPPTVIDTFLHALPPEHRFALLVDLVPAWGALGANSALLAALREAVSS